MLIPPFAALFLAIPTGSASTPPHSNSCAVEVVAIHQPISTIQLMRIDTTDGIRVVPDTLVVRPIQQIVIDPDGE